jgi:hypothetical protein
VRQNIITLGRHSTRSDSFELEFQADAGRHYAAFGFTESVDSRLYIWLIDVDSCTLVAGELPPVETLPCKMRTFLQPGTVWHPSQSSP